MPADELSLGWGAAVTPAWAVDSRLRLVRRQDRVATVFSRGTEDATAGFATADVGATWRYARDHSLRMAVKNLADKAYHEHLTEGVSGQEIQAPGRSLSLAWRGAF
jgi:hemoglobin/transferrin/lactoferrin receptor protein